MTWPMSWPDEVSSSRSVIPCSLFPLVSILLSNLKRTVSSKFFNTQAPAVSTKEFLLRHARCDLSSSLQQTQPSVKLFFSVELRVFHAAQVVIRFMTLFFLHCTVTNCLGCKFFGDSFLRNLWSRSLEVTRPLGSMVFRYASSLGRYCINTTTKCGKKERELTFFLRGKPLR